jgi:hypothetical protein
MRARRRTCSHAPVSPGSAQTRANRTTDGEPHGSSPPTAHPVPALPTTKRRRWRASRCGCVSYRFWVTGDRTDLSGSRLPLWPGPVCAGSRYVPGMTEASSRSSHFAAWARGDLLSRLVSSSRGDANCESHRHHSRGDLLSRLVSSSRDAECWQRRQLTLAAAALFPYNFNDMRPHFSSRHSSGQAEARERRRPSALPLCPMRGRERRGAGIVIARSPWRCSLTIEKMRRFPGTRAARGAEPLS